MQVPPAVALKHDELRRKIYSRFNGDQKLFDKIRSFDFSWELAGAAAEAVLEEQAAGAAPSGVTSVAPR
jgi:hypothetical protein